MKILVPIDFSDCSFHALEAAILIAKKHHSDITIFHSVKGTSILGFDNEEQTKIFFKLASQKIDSLIKEKAAHGIEFTSLVKEGDLFEVIKEECENHNYDLIVIGSHGVSGKKEWFIGSNTQKVIRKVHCNVLVIKNEIKAIDFSEVAFVSGLNKEDQKAFILLMEFIKYFDVKKLHVLSVDTLGYFNQPTFLMQEALKDFKALAKDYDCETHFYSDYTVDAGVRHFSEKEEIDLIAVSNHQRNPIKRIFQGSNVEVIVNHSNVPVISIDYKNK